MTLFLSAQCGGFSLEHAPVALDEISA